MFVRYRRDVLPMTCARQIVGIGATRCKGVLTPTIIISYNFIFIMGVITRLGGRKFLVINDSIFPFLTEILNCEGILVFIGIVVFEGVIVNSLALK